MSNTERRDEGNEVKEQTYSLDVFSDFKMLRYKKTNGMDKFNSLPIVREFMCAETLQNRLLHFKLDHRKKFKRGSYGVVCFYISTETNNDGTYWHLCIKHTHDKNEIKMINSFEEGEVKCGQVEAKLLQYNGNDHYTKHTYKKK